MRVADGQIFVLGSDREATSAGQPAMSPIHQEVHARDDAAAIGTVTGGTVNIAFGDAPSSVRPGAPPAPADQVAELLHQLRRTVRDHAPGTKRDQALTKITALRDAAATMPPDLASMEAIQTWFATELPALSGAVLSAILSFEPVAEELGDEVLLEFRQRFGRIP
jgi:hypothetical protein